MSEIRPREIRASRILLVAATTVSLLLSGCASVDRETLLIGVWKGEERDARLEVRKDATFEASLDGRARRGTWTFDAILGEVVLDVAPAESSTDDAAPDAIGKGPQVWTAFLNRDNQDLRLYLAGPEAIKRLRGTGGGKGLTSGITLKKE